VNRPAPEGDRAVSADSYNDRTTATTTIGDDLRRSWAPRSKALIWLAAMAQHRRLVPDMVRATWGMYPAGGLILTLPRRLPRVHESGNATAPVPLSIRSSVDEAALAEKLIRLAAWRNDPPTFGGVQCGRRAW
jgi:hypothetical protein